MQCLLGVSRDSLAGYGLKLHLRGLARMVNSGELTFADASRRIRQVEIDTQVRGAAK